MNKKTWVKWGIAVLVSFGIFEAGAIFDKNPDTTTLTYNIITYVPEWVFWAVLVPLVSWISYHFYTYYRRR